MKRPLFHIYVFLAVPVALLSLSVNAPSQPLRRASGPASGPQVKFKDGKLTVSANNARIDELIRRICDEANVELVLVGELKKTITRSYVNQPIADVVSSILRGRSYYMTLSSKGVKELRVIGDVQQGMGGPGGAIGGRPAAMASRGRTAIGTPGGLRPNPAKPGKKDKNKNAQKAEFEDIKKDLESRDEFDREGAIYALAEVKGDHAKEAEQLIVKSLKSDKSSDVRIAAATVLGEEEIEAAVPDLISALASDKDEEVREASAEALGNIGDPRSIDALVKALGDDDDWTQDAAEDALIWIADENEDAVVRALKKNLNHERKSVRTRIKDILEELTDEEFDDEE